MVEALTEAVHTAVDAQPRVMAAHVQPQVTVADGRVTAAVDSRRRAVTAEGFLHTVAVLRMVEGDLRTAVAEAAEDMGGKARLGSLPA
jgi:hypothetical protein